MTRDKQISIVNSISKYSFIGYTMCVLFAVYCFLAPSSPLHDPAKYIVDRTNHKQFGQTNDEAVRANLKAIGREWTGGHIK